MAMHELCVNGGPLSEIFSFQTKQNRTSDFDNSVPTMRHDNLALSSVLMDTHSQAELCRDVSPQESVKTLLMYDSGSCVTRVTENMEQYDKECATNHSMEIGGSFLQMPSLITVDTALRSEKTPRNHIQSVDGSHIQNRHLDDSGVDTYFHRCATQEMPPLDYSLGHTKTKKNDFPPYYSDNNDQYQNFILHALSSRTRTVLNSPLMQQSIQRAPRSEDELVEPYIRKCFLRRADGFSDRRMPLDCGRSRTDYSNYSQDDSIELSTGDNGSSSSRNWSHPPAGIDLNSSPIDRNSPRSSDSTSMSAALLHLQLQRAALDDAHDDLLEASSLPASYHLFRGSLLKLARRPQTGYKATKSPALWPLLPHIEERQVQHSSGRKGQAAHSASLVVRNVPSCSDTRRPSNPRKRPANAIFEGAFYNEDVYKSVPEQILDIDNVFPRHNRGTNILLSQPSKCKFSSGLQVPKCRYVCEQPDSICKNQHAAAFPEKASIDSCWRSARERSKMIGTTYELLPLRGPYSGGISTCTNAVSSRSYDENLVAEENAIEVLKLNNTDKDENEVRNWTLGNRGDINL